MFQIKFHETRGSLNSQQSFGSQWRQERWSSENWDGQKVCWLQMAPGYGLTRNICTEHLENASQDMHLCKPMATKSLGAEWDHTFARQPLARGPNRNRRLVNMPFGHEGESKQGASRARQAQPQHCKRTTSNVTPLPGQSDKHINTHPNTHWYSSLLDTDGISETDCPLCPRGAHRRIRNLRLLQLHSKFKDSLKKKSTQRVL